MIVGAFVLVLARETSPLSFASCKGWPMLLEFPLPSTPTNDFPEIQKSHTTLIFRFSRLWITGFFALPPAGRSSSSSNESQIDSALDYGDPCLRETHTFFFLTCFLLRRLSLLTGVCLCLPHTHHLLVNMDAHRHGVKRTWRPTSIGTGSSSSVQHHFEITSVFQGLDIS